MNTVAAFVICDEMGEFYHRNSLIPFGKDVASIYYNTVECEIVITALTKMFPSKTFSFRRVQ